MPKRKVNLAILDMYDGEPNQGMRCIHDLLGKFSDQINFREFDVRGKNELPEVADFDIFISTGGPGNPLEGDGNWDLRYFELQMIDGTHLPIAQAKTRGTGIQ